MLPRWLVACGLLLLVAPTAAAFPGEPRAVVVEYDASRAPLAFTSGAVDAEARMGGAMLVAEAVGTRLGPLRHLDVLIGGDGGARTERHDDVVLILHRGALMAVPDGGASFEISLKAPYALGLGLPQAPIGGDPGPGFLVAAELVEGALRAGADGAKLVPLDAVVSLQERDGRPLPGWDHRHVNAGRAAGDAEEGDAIALQAQGAFAGELRARVVGGALGGAGSLALATRAAEAPRFLDVVDGLAAFGALSGGLAASGIAELAPFADVLNGGVVLMGVAGSDAPPPLPARATVDGEPVDLGGFALVRAERSDIAWSADGMRIQGDARVLVTREGMAVDEPTKVGPIPVLSLLLWLVAIGALVHFFVRRPPASDARHWTLRLAALGAHLVAFAAAFWWWDAQFAATFGTSFLELVASGRAVADAKAAVVLLAFELFPWAMAGLLFALPVRIAAGVALRYAGRGKTLRGFAKAASYVALALVGPYYAMWLLDGAVLRALEAFGGG